MTLLLLYLAIAIGVSFLCSILEAVLLSITPSYLEKLTQSHPKSGQIVAVVKNRMDESLSSILILNTFAHTMGAAGVGSQAIQTFGAEWETLIAVLLTLAILYFSEIIPKTLGATFWQNLAVPAAYVIGWLVKITYPLVWISTLLTRLFSRKANNAISREEISALASIMHRDGTLLAQENEYLNNLLQLRKVRTEDILTPRSVMHSLDQELTVSEALNQPQTRQFTRIPIYRDSIDDITGKVIRADLFEAERAGKGAQAIKTIARKIVRVSEKLPVQNLLDQFIKSHLHLFLVVDEFGQTQGLVTLEDAIETLLGREILDERDTVVDMQELARLKYRNQLREENPRNPGD